MADHKMINKIPDSSSFTITLPAVPESIMDAQQRIRDYVSDLNCNIRSLLELDIIVEETFINIASYAYSDRKGLAMIDLSIVEDGNVLQMVFRDTGVPYDPVQNRAPDISAPAEKRSIGGLGIFLVKEYSDSVTYNYKDGENQLTIRKRIK